MAVFSEKFLKELAMKLEASSVKGPEAIELLTMMTPILRVRSKRLAAFKVFVNGVSEQDRLYNPAWNIWRRKEVMGGIPHWMRANAPALKGAAPEPVHDTDALVTSLVAAGKRPPMV